MNKEYSQPNATQNKQHSFLQTAPRYNNLSPPSIVAVTVPTPFPLPPPAEAEAVAEEVGDDARLPLDDDTVTTGGGD